MAGPKSLKATLIVDKIAYPVHIVEVMPDSTLEGLVSYRITVVSTGKPTKRKKVK